MTTRKSSLAGRAAASGQLNEIEAFMLDSGSELSSLSEDSSSDESFDCPDDIEEEIILEEDEYDNQNIVDMNVDSASQTHNNDSVNNNRTLCSSMF